MENQSHHEDSVWQADLVSILALVIFVLVVIGFERFLQPSFTGLSLLLTGVVLTLVPAAIWLAFFYRRDRLEPEPKGLIIQVAVLGGLLAGAIGVPLLENVFDINSWLTRNAVTHLLGSILVVGFTHEFLKYAAVRFSVYGASEFDEPVDGIIYATAAGIGYATVLNLLFVINSGGVDLSSGIIRITVTSLAHASFAGVMGYYLGTEKFENRPVWWSPLGVALAAVLNGIFFYLRSTLTQGNLTVDGGGVQRWLGFVLAALLAGVVTFFLSRAIKTHMRQPAGEEA